jgi:hypothetical protein
LIGLTLGCGQALEPASAALGTGTVGAGVAVFWCAWSRRIKAECGLDGAGGSLVLAVRI